MKGIQKFQTEAPGGEVMAHSRNGKFCLGEQCVRYRGRRQTTQQRLRALASVKL